MGAGVPCPAGGSKSAAANLAPWLGVGVGVLVLARIGPCLIQLGEKGTELKCEGQVDDLSPEHLGLQRLLVAAERERDACRVQIANMQRRIPANQRLLVAAEREKMIYQLNELGEQLEEAQR